MHLTTKCEVYAVNDTLLYSLPETAAKIQSEPYATHYSEA